MKTNKIFLISMMFLLALTIVAQTPIGRPRESGGMGDTAVLQVQAKQVSQTRENDDSVQKYEGNVVAQLGEVVIHADKLTVNQTSRTFIATGAVSITIQGQTIKASQLEWGYGPTPIKMTLLF